MARDQERPFAAPIRAEPERLRRARIEDRLLAAHAAAMGVLAGLLCLAALMAAAG